MIDKGWDRWVEVAPGIVLVHYPLADRRGKYMADWWHLLHPCPKVYRGNGEEEAVPMVAIRLCANEPGGHEVLALDPLTISPSILEDGCGLHGFVTNGAWVEAGTPAETADYIAKHAHLVIEGEAAAHGFDN